MPDTNTLELEVFRAGNYGDKGSFSEEDLDTMSTDYNPMLHEAPVTVDHRQTGPAYGWVASLKRVGDRLIARIRNLNDEFLNLVRSGAFKKRSIELYRSFSGTGRPYLRAVSFLGAKPPEVKGLADVTFTESTGYDSYDLDSMCPSIPVPETDPEKDDYAESQHQIEFLRAEKEKAERELQLLLNLRGQTSIPSWFLLSHRTVNLMSSSASSDTFRSPRQQVTTPLQKTRKEQRYFFNAGAQRRDEQSIFVALGLSRC